MRPEIRISQGSALSRISASPSQIPAAARAQTTSEWPMAAEPPSNAACPAVPRVATTNAAIMLLLWPGSSACSAPSRTARGR